MQNMPWLLPPATQTVGFEGGGRVDPRFPQRSWRLRNRSSALQENFSTVAEEGFPTPGEGGAAWPAFFCFLVQASSAFTTSPLTSVSRKSRPMNR